MNRLLIALLSLLFLLPSPLQAKTGMIFVTALTAGTAGSLDAVECGDIIGDNTNRPIAEGDVALVVTSGKLFYIYRYDASGTDVTSSPSIIVPNDRSLCSNVGQWELVEKFYLYDADGTDKYHPPRAIAIADIASGDSGVAGIGTGIFRNDAWAMTANQDEGKEVWASVTPGAITLTPPSTSLDQLALVGYVKAINIVQFNLGNVVLFEVP
jgi:hypothetical protein